MLWATFVLIQITLKKPALVLRIHFIRQTNDFSALRWPSTSLSESQNELFLVGSNFIFYFSGETETKKPLSEPINEFKHNHCNFTTDKVCDINEQPKSKLTNLLEMKM